MKCRYIESVSNTSITVTTSRNGVVSLGCSLAFDDRTVLFAVCTGNDPSNLRWVTIWTRWSDSSTILINENLDTIHPSLNALDSQVVENIVNFITMEFEPSEIQVEDNAIYEDSEV